MYNNYVNEGLHSVYRVHKVKSNNCIYVFE